MESGRGHWYLLTAIILGFGMGLFYAWVISPVQMKETHPYTLRPDYKDIYRALVAFSYQATGDLTRAQARLDLLRDDDPAQVLAGEAQQILAEGGDYREARALANLSASLLSGQPVNTRTSVPTEASNRTPAVPSPEPPDLTVTPGEETLTPEPTTSATVTRTPQFTATATATQAPPFVLKEEKAICDPSLTTSLIQVYALDASGEGVPGVEVVITWEEDQERFFTGLKPEFGVGYGDFEMSQGVTYTLTVPGTSVRVTGIEVQECETDEDTTYWGSWQVILTHPN